MKIVILNNDFRAYWKGRLVYLRSYLSAKGIDWYAIELFGKGSPYNFDTAGNTQIGWWFCLFPNNSSDQLSKTQMQHKLFAALDEIKPDVVIGPSIVFFAGALGNKWAKSRRKHFVMFDDVKPWQAQRNFVVQWIKQTLIKQTDALWLPDSNYDADYGFMDKDVVLIHGFNAVDNAHFKNNDKQYNNEVICVARLVPVKNIDTLLNAWQIVEQQRNFGRLTIVGDGPLLAQLKQQAQNLALTRVHFEGAVDNENLPLKYHQADVLILPSLSETWGLVVNEAMAAGLPVLLSNKVNAVESLLKEAQNGYGFEPEYTDAIAAVILRYLDMDRAARQSMSACALQTIGKMDYPNMANRLCLGLEQLQQKKIGRPGPVARLIISLWPGKYDTSVWDKI